MHFTVLYFIVGYMRCEKKYITSKGSGRRGRRPGSSFGSNVTRLSIESTGTIQTVIMIVKIIIISSVIWIGITIMISVNFYNPFFLRHLILHLFVFFIFLFSFSIFCSSGSDGVGDGSSSVRAMSTRPRKSLPDTSVFFPASYGDTQTLLARKQKCLVEISWV